MHATVIIPLLFGVLKNIKGLSEKHHSIGSMCQVSATHLCVIWNWTTAYDVHRHPLLAFFYYQIYLINQGLMSLLGINCVQFLVAIVLLISSLYAFLLMIRMGRNSFISHNESLLYLLFYSSRFAYVLLATISPRPFHLVVISYSLSDLCDR